MPKGGRQQQKSPPEGIKHKKHSTALAKKQVRAYLVRDVAFMISKSHDQLTTLYDIAARIGDTVEQVMKTYGHLFPRKKKDYLDKFNSLDI